METYNGLPLVEFTIDGEGLAVETVSLVDKPAIKKSFQMFAEAKTKPMFFADEERQIISGALMLADTPIFRADAKNGDFYGLFSAATIEKIAVKFFENNYQKNVSFSHNGQLIDGFVMFESFICDQSRGILPMKGFEDVPDGSWFGSFKVTNPDTWAKVKELGVSGFSVEGLFRLSSVDSQDGFWEELEEILA
jgi:hypothetical protein